MINTSTRSEPSESDTNKESLLTDSSIATPLLNYTSNQYNRFDGLSKIDILAYGVGHFINDLTVTCWFNYTLFFLTEVVQTPAGPYAILVGQIADKIATPIFGALSDKFQTRIGQRKPWYIGGLVLLICTFLPIFQNFSIFSDNKNLEIVYYILFPSLFNIGWSAIQISHMSLVPSLTCSRKRRDKLNNVRNSFTFLANFTVLTLGLIFFSTMSNRTLEFNLISYIVVILGTITSIFFLWKINEPKLTQICKQKASALQQQLNESLSPTKKILGSQTSYSDDDNLNIHASQKVTILSTSKHVEVTYWYDRLKLVSFYIFGICYMGVRVYCNVFGTLLPFYLIYVLKMGTQQVDQIPFAMALVQLLIYASSVTTNLFLLKIYDKFGRKNALLAGGLFCLSSALSMIFLKPTITWPIYIIAVSIGIAQSMTLSTGVNLISEVIGSRSKKGAIVFGMYSLLDKFASGIIIFVISNSEMFITKNVMFIKMMTVIVPSSACLLSCILVYFTPIQEYKKEKSLKSNVKKRKISLEEELVV